LALVESVLEGRKKQAYKWQVCKGQMCKYANVQMANVQMVNAQMCQYARNSSYSLADLPICPFVGLLTC
jgi:hypothetical protein